MLFLKTKEKLFGFLRVESNFFHSMIVKGKKELEGSCCVMLGKICFQHFLWHMHGLFQSISLKKYLGFSSLKNLHY